MCGLIGFASTEGMKGRLARQHYMRMGLDIDSWRGWDSTGMALINEKNSPLIYKRAINGRDFIQLQQVHKYLNDVEKYPVVIGHNRSATVGRGNLVDHNAHPFNYGRITLVHNGHIRNTHELKGAHLKADCQVDSAHVACSMDVNGEQETLEMVEGGFAFVWWNEEAGLLNVARNGERPLHMAYAAKENTLFWASEFTQLLHLMQDIEIDEDMGVMFPGANCWYQFSLKDLRSYKRVPFVKSHGRQKNMTQIQMVVNGPHGAMDEEWTPEDLAQLELMEEECDIGLPISTTTREQRTSTAQTTSDREEIDDIRQDLSDQRKITGRPSTRKKVKQAENKLRTLNLRFNELRNCKPIFWTLYKNQTHLGAVLARTNEKYLVEIPQVTQAEFVEYQRHNNVLVNVVNVRMGPNKEPHIIGIVSPKMAEYLEYRKNNPKDRLGSIDRTCKGPEDGVLISPARFVELTDGGCANCTQPIDAAHHELVVWVGRPPQAIGPCCNTDPGVMELLGVPDAVRQLRH